MNTARSIIYSATIATGLFAAPLSASTIDVGDIMANFGLVALNNLTAESSETETLVYVGNNLEVIQNSYDVNADKLANGTVGSVSGALIVGGGVVYEDSVQNKNSVNVNVISGDAVVGSVESPINVTTTTGGTLTTGSTVSAAEVDAVEDAFVALSSDLAAMDNTNGANFDFSDQNNVTLTSGTEDFAVYNLETTLSSFLINGALKSHLYSNTADTFIINVPGTDIDLTLDASVGATTGGTNVIFNFYEATNVLVNSSNFGFGILAPLAYIDVDKANSEGFVIGYDVTQSTEIRGTFTGTLPSGGSTVAPVPLPASGVLLFGALAGAAALRRRKAKAAA